MWEEGSLSFWVGLFPELFFDPQVNEEISAFVRDKIRARIKDPKVAEKLIPTSYGFGTRRVPLETNYFEAYNRDNVELVDVKEDPIERLTERGVQTADGTVHEVDILILATGFDAGTGALTRIDIRGRDGRTLKDEWRPGNPHHDGPADPRLPQPLHHRRAARAGGGAVQHDHLPAAPGRLDHRLHRLPESSRPDRDRADQADPGPMGRSTTTTSPTRRSSPRPTRGTWARTSPESSGECCRSPAASEPTIRNARSWPSRATPALR